MRVVPAKAPMPRVIFTVALFLVPLLFSACSDRQEATFLDVKAARAAGAVARGWVPIDLPESATELQELHDLDTNEVWGTFRLPPTDTPGTIGLTRVEASRIDGHPVRSPSVGWWPRELSGDLSARSLQEQGFELYSTPAPNGFWIAVNRARGRGFFWSMTR